MSYSDSYSLIEEIGRGHYSVVHRCERKDGEKFAAKVILKGTEVVDIMDEIRREVELLKEVKGHEHITTIEDSFESENELIIIMDLMEGGMLFDQIVRQKHYSETSAAVVLRNLLSALKHMHERGIAHRDLKPENIMLTVKSDITHCKIVDFGFAEKCPPNLSKCCGTPLYIAPEILNCGLFKTGDEYGLECDMWSLGVIAYILLCGYPPFRGRSTNEQFKAIVRGRYSYPANKVWGVISDPAKEFVSSLLILDTSERATAGQALEAEWIISSSDPDENLTETVANLVDFNARQHWRKGIFGVEAITRLQYAASCKALCMKPNSDIIRMFNEATTQITIFDLSRNYVGPKGIMSLLPILQENSQIEKLIFGNNGLNNAVMEELCRVLKKHKGVKSVVLSENPISHMAGRHLLSAIQFNTNIVDIELEGTNLLDSTIKKIEAQLARNREACAAT
eukprot:TRINITY_DN11366_c0_g2_i1.p1 TRINITY_DN11366_c0_g2~~TRINITY_DN11366_c0_g2_i1.p1  ORF type:complete len:480 (+),score=66.47 TRINITY_DN11366_c0_g2_i1:83-1441(+)